MVASYNSTGCAGYTVGVRASAVAPMPTMIA
jgi:hypothetical protein